MKCPRCSGTTKVMHNHGVKLDVCYDGCGGIWFDWLELKKVDEQHEADPKFLTELAKSKTRKISLSERIDCPHCAGVTLMRRFWSIERSVELDECAKCGGIWLDAGELTHIHSLYKTEAERRAAAQDYIDEVFKAQIETKPANDTAVTKLKSVFRVIVPK